MARATEGGLCWLGSSSFRTSIDWMSDLLMGGLDKSLGELSSRTQ